MKVKYCMFYEYLDIGWGHIISVDALDHILFIVVLTALYTIKDWRKLLWLVTSFTLGHSITLALSVLNVLRLPGKIIEILIPVTIIVTAVFNLFQLKPIVKTNTYSYLLALFFGLIHGLGFASGLRSLLGTGHNILLPLIGFNIGLEVGQITVIVAILFIGFAVFNWLKANRRDWIVFTSGAACSVAVKMILDR